MLEHLGRGGVDEEFIEPGSYWVLTPDTTVLLDVPKRVPYPDVPNPPAGGLGWWEVTVLLRRPPLHTFKSTGLVPPFVGKLGDGDREDRILFVKN